MTSDHQLKQQKNWSQHTNLPVTYSISHQSHCDSTLKLYLWTLPWSCNYAASWKSSLAASERADHVQAVPSGLQGNEWTCTVIYKRTMCASHNRRYALCSLLCSPCWPLRSTRQAPTWQPGNIRGWSNCMEQFASNIQTAPTPFTFKNLLKIPYIFFCYHIISSNC